MTVYKNHLALEFPNVGYTLYLVGTSNPDIGSTHKSFFEVPEKELEDALAKGQVYLSQKNATFHDDRGFDVYLEA